MRKYAYAEQSPTKKLSAQERAKLLALRKSPAVANNQMDIFAFHLNGQNRWISTHLKEIYDPDGIPILPP